MGYPYDKSYLEQIKENKKECEKIINAFYVLRKNMLKKIILVIQLIFPSRKTLWYLVKLLN